MGLASKKNRTQATGALGALVDLLGPGSILPPSRKLRTFVTQPTLLASVSNAAAFRWEEGDELPRPLTRTDLIYWLYEDWLKGTYFQVILLLEAWVSDDVEYSRIKGMDFAYCLLKEKPEQEANLLRLLVDKLGDRERRVSSRASYLILQLQTLHPGMRPVIVEAIDKDLLLDPARCIRARYHAINTLNQTLLTNKESDIAKRLLEIYFGLFATLLEVRQLGTVSDGHATLGAKRKAHNGCRPQSCHGKWMNAPLSSPANTTEAVDKLVTAILTGVNRAIPFVSASNCESVMHP
jgi:ribosome biogenesis protein MAK21